MLFPDPSENIVEKKSSGKMENTGVPRFLLRLLKLPSYWSPHSCLVPLQSSHQHSQGDSFKLKANYVAFLHIRVEWLVFALQIKMELVNRSQKACMDPAVSCLSTTFSGLHIHWLPFSSLKASCLLLPQDLCTYHFSFLNVLLLPVPASVCSPFRAQLNHCLPHKILSHLPHCIMAPLGSSS